MQDERRNVKVRLRRDLGLLDVTMIGIGAMTGASIIVLAGVATHEAGPSVLLVIVLSFIITILTAMSYAELAGALPEAGGGYLWVKEGLPHPFGFVGGWISWFGHSIACSFYTVIFGIGVVWLLGAYNIHFHFLPNDEWMARGLAVSVLVIFLAINYIGTKHTGKAGDVISFIQLTIVIGFIALAMRKSLENPDFTAGFVPFFPNGIDGMLIALSLLVICFEGYEIIAQCAEETKNPEKNLPKAIFISIGFVAVLYFMLLLSAIGATSWQYLGSVPHGGEGVPDDPKRGLTEVSSIVMPWGIGGTIMIIAMLIGTMATLNATTFSSSRISFAMARDGALPKSFAKIHPRFRTPYISVIASGLIIGFMAIFLPVEDIVAGADIMFILLFIFVNIALIVLRYKKPNIRRTFRVPMFPLTPVLAIISLTILGISVYWYSPLAWYIALVWIEAGMLIYLFGRGRKDIATARPEVFLELIEKKTDTERFSVLVSAKDDDSVILARIGAVIAAQNNGVVEIINVLVPPRSLPPSAVGFSEVNAHMNFIKKLERGVRAEKVDVESNILISNNVPATLLEESEAKKANLIILGWSGASRRGIIFGSTIDPVVSKTKSDVIVVKTEGLTFSITKIMVVAGPEWHASYAAEIAGTLAKKFNADITIFGMGQTPNQEEYVRTYSEKLIAQCLKSGIDPSKVTCKYIVTKDVVNTTVNYAEEYDLLVLGASEVVWAPSHVIMGLVEDRIARAASKPVLMVRKVRK